VNAGEESLRRVLAQGCWSEQVLFGSGPLNNSDHSGFTAEGEPGDFKVLKAGRPVARVQWAISGLHNQLNALAAIAAAEHVGVAPEQAARALAEFQNVKRRMEVRATSPSTTILRITRRRSTLPWTACAASLTAKGKPMPASWPSSSRAATP
jgi:UDP-N-acetylmuramate: L-alanyl-gamma-D-glutamyl-meso-diaminopimelate ligase